MRIKKLEISGFKSFVDRTVVHFDSDVVGIVGPNGCGKSNIVDAIRWCMGEQSAKHLRGRAMTDVIFSGSESRGPHGFAEVTLTFDNTDPERSQNLPLEYKDYAEIAVTRRLYRDGSSEYLINKTQVRLKDITDLFLGTGVGTKAYSIIEQGKIGLIVSARPEDRRMLIEEAAGITKYKARKKQAEQRMDQTRQNLLRVGDIVSEIERSLASLRRQAAKAERYVAYRKELEDLTLHEAAHRFLEIEVTTQAQTRLANEAREHAQRTRAALDAREAEIDVDKQAALAAEEVAEKTHAESFRATSEVRSLEAAEQKALADFRTAERRRAAATQEQNELEATARGLDGERETLAADLESAADDEQNASSAALGEHEKLEELRAGERSASDQVSGLRRRASEAQAKVAGAEATLLGFDRRLGDLSQRRTRCEDELGRLKFEAEDADGRRSALLRHASDVAEGKRTTAERRAALEAELKTLRESAVGLDKRVDHEKGELSQKRGRLRALEEIHARLEGVGAGVKALLGKKDASLLGLVADRIEAPAELTDAFAALLGDVVQCIVVADVDRATALLGELASGKKGRASIVAAHPPFVAGAAWASREVEDRLQNEPGFVCRLADRIHVDEADEPLARALVGDALVAETPEAARRIARLAPGRTVVSLDGFCVRPSGVMSGGSGDLVAAGLATQKREMRELHEVVAEKSDEVTRLLAEQQAHRARLTEVQLLLETARTEAHQGELAAVTAEKDLRRAEEQLAAARKREDQLSNELEELAEAIEKARDERAAADERLEDGRRVVHESAAALEQADQLAAEWRERALQQQSIVTEHKVVLARSRERASGFRAALERIARSCDELAKRIQRLDAERTSCAIAAGQAAAVIATSRAAIAEAVVVARAAEQALVAAKSNLESTRAALASREADLKSLRIETGAAAEKLAEHEMALQRLDISREHLLAGVAEKFHGLELPRIIGDYHKRPLVDARHRARITELAELIDRMGPVNLDAVREHEEADSRHKYYAEQKADLEKAIADLVAAIDQMNKECKKLFRTTFDGVNARFKQLFPRMFRGGAAELRLTNPDDMLETGIEILAQPPGKKLASIELMSGGEKALTAVSLIFAIFQFKPSPFCVLDEVDAPLDEANVTRYNEAIRAMTGHSQFILITHIKRTMQSVDVLYGVTMQEAGVSKLVSVRVNDTAPAPRTKAPAAPTEAAAVA